ncbi:MAG TPA: DUF3604 domain-containing protein [Acidobacteriota bacterium]|nr:DUF3604 domain-containing protein [Acidobacteriota bacterium]
MALLATALAQECEGRGYSPTKNVYWGDLHTHTAFSFDAVTIGTRTTPRDAYQFAKGAAIGLPPYDQAGQPLRTTQLMRPLDFLAVTDHSEYFGEVRACLTCADPGVSPDECQNFQYSPLVCKALRQTVMNLNNPDGRNIAGALWGSKLFQRVPNRFPFTCGVQVGRSRADDIDVVDCPSLEASVWSEVKTIARDAYQPCEFTSFVAYEWTGTPQGNNWHRNVIFRNESVPGLPISYFESPQGEGGPVKLWRLLERECLEDTPGCDVLAIPHNSNIGLGLFPVPKTAEEAQTQIRFEPLAEIHQTKGNSECRWGVGTTDEECQFELLSRKQLFGNPVEGPTNYQDPSQSPMEAQQQGFELTAETGDTYNYFLRESLKAGLYLGQGLGINPYKTGFVGGTDTHNSTPGSTEEVGFEGQHGLEDNDIPKRLSLATSSGSDPAPSQAFLENNPGGLTAVWAEENTRDSIFDSLTGKETYATSGIRPVVRFFGGWDYPLDMCDQPDFAQMGYQSGVPMGSDLGARPAGDPSPRFAVMAMKDPDSELDARLQRIQVVKGWIDSQGVLHEQVFDVDSDPTEGPFPAHEDYVDLATCEAKPDTPGKDMLCTVWQDPQFDPSQSAFYYARVLQNPTCRWSTYQCIQLEQTEPENNCRQWLATPANADTAPGVIVGYTIQERAWTSAIWYEPK